MLIQILIYRLITVAIENGQSTSMLEFSLHGNDIMSWVGEHLRAFHIGLLLDQMELSLSWICKLHELLYASYFLLPFSPFDSLRVNMLLSHGILQFMLIKVLITLGKIVASVSLDIVIKVAEIEVFHINLPRFDNLAA